MSGVVLKITATDGAPIATSDELELIARSDDADAPVLRGWRKKLFGDAALALKRGELALVIREGEVTVLAPQGSAAAEEPKDET